MAWESREIPFQVDMAGIIEILGHSLYSRKDTAIRELIQNGHDAIVRRRASDLGFLGSIRIRLDAEACSLSFTDDGIGLSIAEAEAYLGTLGTGLSGLLKRERTGGASGIIGQFGIGLFSAFLLAETIVVESRKSADEPAVRWQAGAGTSILVGLGERATPGTTVTLKLSAENADWSRDPERVRAAVAAYADFLPVPIFLGDARRRLNVMTPSWFEATPDPEMVSMELEQRFDDEPLDVLLIRREEPRIQGALFITRGRTPGFSGRPLVTATVRRMVISTRLDGLFPDWGPFYRGVLELPDLQPTTSREDLIRNADFQVARDTIEELLYRRLEELAAQDPVRLRAIATWHRYTFSGAALDAPRLRAILAGAYLFTTTDGPRSFDELVPAGDEKDDEAEAVLWLNSDRQQAPWIQSVFEGLDVPCVQALRTFEATLLAAMAADRGSGGQAVLLERAAPTNERFVRSVLGIAELEDLSAAWDDFFAGFFIRVRSAGFHGALPALAFLNRGAELRRDFEQLKQDGAIPSVFSRMIDRHFEDSGEDRHEVILNTRHRIVRSALAGSVHSPLASVLRLLVHNALAAAGAEGDAARQETVLRDLDWISETIAPRDKDAEP